MIDMNRLDRPERLDPLQPGGARRLAELEAAGVRIVDVLADDVEDLFRLDFPFIPVGAPEYDATRQRYPERYPTDRRGLDRLATYFFFPWRNVVVAALDEPDFMRLRTARNLFLVTREEQRRFYDSHLAFAGLSVGSAALNTVILSGGSRRVSIADPDVLATVNLNRLAASICDLGEQKTTLARSRVYELNPYAEVYAYKGVTDDNLDDFLGGRSPVDVLIEEMDDLRLKAQVRFAARERGIPVVMATDDGDSALLDVERFDLEPERPLFHGTVPEDTLRNIPEIPSPAERVTIASAIVGLNISTRTQLSMQLVGSQIPTWPQLATGATVSGASVCYVARRIVTGQHMPSGRYRVSLDKALDPMYDNSGAIAERRTKTEDFKIGLELIFGA